MVKKEVQKKTGYLKEDIQAFLQNNEHADPDSIQPLTEGHIAQAFSFESVDGNKLVLRIASQNKDFLTDQYAYNRYGVSLHVPKVIEIGRFGKDAYYCITKFAPGVISNKLSSDEMQAALPDVHETIAKLFKIDVSDSTGYGNVDIRTGNAKYPDWKTALTTELDDINVESLKKSAEAISLDSTLIDRFIKQFNKNLPFASEVRRLVHGDLGFDNLLVVDNGKVSAVIDWAHIGYGDWMRDFSKFDFWWPDRYGDAQAFADKYELDAEHIIERMLLYWAITALETINFADRYKNNKIAGWLREHVAKKLA